MSHGAAVVRLCACMSLDGYISTGDGRPPNQVAMGGWTSAEDKDAFKQNIRWADLLVMGRRTAEESQFLLRRKSAFVLSSLPNAPGGAPVLPPDPTAVREWLVGLGDKKVLLCGGELTFSFFIQHGFVDEVYLSLEPVMLGHGARLIRLGQRPANSMFELKWKYVLNTDGTMALFYTNKRASWI